MEFSAVRSLSQCLITSAIQRCRVSDKLCRLSIAIKCIYGSSSPVALINVADTGVGISYSELRNMDLGEHTSSQKWDGLLSIATTSISDNEVCRYRLNMKETVAEKRLKRLTPTPKNVGTFSGTDISFSSQESIEELVSWMTQFYQKIVISRLPIVIELEVEYVDGASSRRQHHFHPNEGILLQDSERHVELLSSSFRDYVTRHRNVLDKQCQTCFSSNDNLKVGYGACGSTETLKSARQIVEAVIVVTTAPESSNHLCRTALAPATEVLYFLEFTPRPLPQPFLHSFTGTDWKNYGLSLKTVSVNLEGLAVLEWENLLPFTHIDIILHCFHEKVTPFAKKKTQSDKNLIKKALTLALDDLKAKFRGYFLSRSAQKIRNCAPDLSRSIASLIQSSNDSDFKAECAALLGLQRTDIEEDGKVEFSIRDKIIGVIEMNDVKGQASRKQAPALIENSSMREDAAENEYEFEEADEYVDMSYL